MGENPQSTEDGRCSEVAELLSPYVDGEATAAEKALVEAHLASCEDCAQELDSLRCTVGLLQALPAVEVRRSFTLQPEPKRQTTLFYLLRNATAALAAVLLVLLGGSAYLQPAAPQPATTALYSRSGVSKAEDAQASIQSRAAEVPKAEAKKAIAPQARALEEPSAPATTAAPAPAAAAVPRAAAPAGASAPTGVESAQVAPPEPAAAPPALGETSATQDKGNQKGAGESAAGVAKSEQPQHAPEQKIETAEARPEKSVEVGETDSILATASKLPLREIQIGVGILLMLTVGATTVVWLRAK